MLGAQKRGEPDGFASLGGLGFKISEAGCLALPGA